MSLNLNCNFYLHIHINQMSKKVNQGNPNLKGLEEELLNLNKKLNEIKNQLLE